MRTLTVLDVISDSPQFAKRHQLHLPRKGETVTARSLVSDKGRFGEVWSAEHDKRSAEEPPFVVKVIDEQFSLGESVSELHRALERCGDRDWPIRLQAPPYSLVIAQMDGEEREVTFMLDLGARGYEGAEPIFELSAVRSYIGRPVHERVELARSYAQAAALLESIKFLHGDQNFPNLMLNLSTLDTQIIDLDAGAILRNGDERAITDGKQGNFLPPEARIPGSEKVDKSRWDAGAERWPVGILVGYLSLGNDPSFFIKPFARAFDGYAEEGPWPGKPSDLWLPDGMGAAHREWLPFLEAAPGDLVVTFARFFRAGTRGADRPTAQDWVKALDAARKKPEFKVFKVEPAVAPEGTEVVISWKAEGAEYVEHPSLGKLPAKGEESMVVTRSARQRLAAVNFYGRVERESEVIRVVPLPRLTTIPIGGFPGLQLSTRIATGAPALPPQLPPPRFTRELGIPPAPPVAASGPKPLPAPPHFGELFGPVSVPRRLRLSKKGANR